MIDRRGFLAASAALAAASLIGCQLQPRLTAPDGRHIFRLPQPSTARIGDVTLHTLENGLTLLHQESRGNSIIGLTALVRSGSAQVLEREAGLHNLMMRVISKGTKRRNSDQIAEELGQLGASLGASAGHDYSRLSLQCVNEDFAEAIDLFADVMLNPTFPLDQVELERRRVLASIRMADDQTSSLTMKRFRQEVFGTHPYGRPIEGYPETVANLQPIQLAEVHQADFVPSATVLAVVGAISFNKLLPLIERHLGAVGPRREERYEVDKVIAPGAAVLSSQRTPSRDSSPSGI